MSCTCYNFCLYAYLNDHFRKQFKDVLPCFDYPFFQRNNQRDNVNDQPVNAVGTLKPNGPSLDRLNVTTTMPLTSTKDFITKTGMK